MICQLIWKDKATLLKMNAELTFKQNEKQYYNTLCSS